MSCDNKTYWYGVQCDAAFGLFRKSDFTLDFLNLWLTNCKDERILMDIANTCGRPNLPGFIEHRWDQSVLSLLAEKQRITFFRMPSQFGNHYKDPLFRVAGEFNCVNQYDQRQVKFYAEGSFSNSPYFQLLNHHRSQLNEDSAQKKKVRLIDKVVRRILRQWSAVKGLVSRWYHQRFT